MEFHMEFRVYINDKMSFYIEIHMEFRVYINDKMSFYIEIHMEFRVYPYMISRVFHMDFHYIIIFN